MPLKTKEVGSDESLVTVIGDMTDANAMASVLTFINARSLSGKYGPIFQNVPLLLNLAGTHDMAIATPGVTGVPVVSIESIRPTYSTGSLAVTLAATATDFWTLVGSASKTVRLLWLAISGIADAAVTKEIALIKRTTANSGGTASAPTIAQHDSNDAEATAVVNLYSANPAGLGTSDGNVRVGKLNLGVTGAAGILFWDFTTRNSKGLVLRGVAQAACLNWGGAVVTAGTSLAIAAEFSEETA